MSASAQSNQLPPRSATSPELLLVSIVISTYRRLDMLRDALASMRDLAVRDGLTYELLIIDNDSQQSARELVESEQSDWPSTGCVRYVHESRPGLSHVRNRGLDVAQGQIVAFLDDDIFIDKKWLLEIVACFARTGADCVHGRTRVHWDGEPEAVVRACFQNDGGSGEFEVPRNWLPGGGNMAVRRGIVTEGYRFFEGFGRIGTVLLSGEDTEMTRRMQRAGKRIWYCGTAVMNHRTGGQRLYAPYYSIRAYWIGLSYALIDQRLHGKAYQVVSAIARTAYVLAATAPSWVMALLGRDATKRMRLKLFVARQFGYLRATFYPAAWSPASCATIAQNKAEDR